MGGGKPASPRPRFTIVVDRTKARAPWDDLVVRTIEIAALFLFSTAAIAWGLMVLALAKRPAKLPGTTLFGVGQVLLGVGVGLVPFGLDRSTHWLDLTVLSASVCLMIASQVVRRRARARGGTSSDAPTS
jgi:hypothetical protein